MTGSLRQAWIYTPTDLWEQLASFAAKDVVAPPDLFSDLFIAVDDYLAVATVEPQPICVNPTSDAAVRNCVPALACPPSPRAPRRIAHDSPPARDASCREPGT